ncbi:DExH-box splicing factor binding site-domain-containing protein [Mycena rosella]|uniref:DExH-box splicing factor binding site-domain-containing protein n=1 Tax=Mycena rosella TaxID=1033263 RepID=A0AAD7DGU8_MYCRO|nr:DExH-box splicing factor binding site-domain-containing protein [Mycena rosella]
MSKVSFTIRRPTPISRDASSGPESDSSNFKVPALPRHLAQDSAPGSPLSRSRTSSPPARYHDPDSSDEDEDGLQDELVTGFDALGAQRCVSFLRSTPQPSQLTSVFFHNSSHSSLHKSKKVPQGPLVIPALKNRDWRELARKRRSAAQFVPESAKAATGKDGSVGGLGVKDTINSGPVLSGLQVRAKVKKEEDGDDVDMTQDQAAEMVDVKAEEETEDQRALRAILAAADGVGNTESMIDIIPTPMSEEDAYKQDVDELPDVATLDDYNRVPVAQFGLALLRGMGWKEGTAASRKPGKGLVQPYLPEARPALLGIGAKEREVLDDGSTKKSNANKRPERRYVPVIKQDREERPASAVANRAAGMTDHAPRGETTVLRAFRAEARGPGLQAPSRPRRSQAGFEQTRIKL